MNNTTAPLAVWGMGNPLHRDDGAGVRAAEMLRENPGKASLEVAVCETQPENFLGCLRRRRPSTLLILDATDMGLPPGSLGRFSPARMVQEGWSTHGYPLDRLLEPFLGQFPIFCLGIQPGDTELGMELSPAVEAGVQRLVELLRQNRWEEIPELRTPTS